MVLVPMNMVPKELRMEVSGRPLLTRVGQIWVEMLVLLPLIMVSSPTIPRLVAVVVTLLVATPATFLMDMLLTAMEARKLRAVTTVVPPVVLQFLTLLAGLVLVQFPVRVLSRMLLNRRFPAATLLRTQPAALPMTLSTSAISLLIRDLCNGCRKGTVLFMVVLKQTLMFPVLVVVQTLGLHPVSNVPPVAIMEVLDLTVVSMNLWVVAAFLTSLTMTLEPAVMSTALAAITDRLTYGNVLAVPGRWYVMLASLTGWLT